MQVNIMSEKERGSLLNAWLVLMLVANIATTLLYGVFATSPFGRSLFLSNVELSIINVLIILGSVNVVCVCFLFFWKKWAFYVLCASAVAAFIINLYVGAGFYAFIGFAGILTFYLIIRSKWKFFSNF